MSEMVERVARAMALRAEASAAEIDKIFGVDDPPAKMNWENFVDQARAAIEAIYQIHPEWRHALLGEIADLGQEIDAALK